MIMLAMFITWVMVLVVFLVRRRKRPEIARRRRIYGGLSLALGLASLAFVGILFGVSGPGFGIARFLTPSGRRGPSHVYVTNAAGTGQTKLTNGPALDGEPAWSPDGRRITFTRMRDGEDGIYVMNAGGTGQRGLAKVTIQVLLTCIALR